MVQIISGKKGKGKTKYLLDSVNGAVASAQGSVVYLDKTAKHMYELSNKVRLINVSDYGINSYDAFIGFVSGIISQDHDLEKMYFDSFLKISCLEGSDITEAIKALEAISAKFGVDFVLSVSADATENVVNSGIANPLKKEMVIQNSISAVTILTHVVQKI